MLLGDRQQNTETRLEQYVSSQHCTFCVPISISRLQHSEQVYAIHWDDEIKGFGVRRRAFRARPLGTPLKKKLPVKDPSWAPFREKENAGALCAPYV
jgi:hypothetical protein